MRTTKLLAAVLTGLAVTACSGSPGEPTDPTRSSQPTTPTEPTEPPSERTIDFEKLSLTLEVPGRFGDGYDGGLDDEKCGFEEYTWNRLPNGDDTEVLTIGTTTTPCPDEQAVNGRFPTWDSAGQLPDDAEPVTVPSGEGHRFSVDYTQCTNECNQYVYDYVFVELKDGRSYWVQSSDVDQETVDAIVTSIVVR